MSPVVITSSARPHAPQMEQLDTRPCDREGGAGRPLLSGNLQTMEHKRRKRGNDIGEKAIKGGKRNEVRRGRRGRRTVGAKGDRQSGLHKKHQN